MSQTMWHTLFCVLLDSATSSPVGGFTSTLISCVCWHAVRGIWPFAVPTRCHGHR